MGKRAALILLLCLDLPLSSPVAASGPALTEVEIVRGNEDSGDVHMKNPLASFIVETAATTADRKKGLSGRQSMPGDRGMLFLLDDRRPVFFWMKGMLFPLDILFFDRNGRLTEIFAHQIPCDLCNPIHPAEPPAYALEINAGLAKKFGLRPGDILVIDKKQTGSKTEE